MLCYRALLAKAGLSVPTGLKPQTEKLFSKEFLQAMQQSGGKDPAAYARGAAMLAKPAPTWAEMVEACSVLRDYLHDGTSGYVTFN